MLAQMLDSDGTAAYCSSIAYHKVHQVVGHRDRLNFSAFLNAISLKSEPATLDLRSTSMKLQLSGY